MKNQSNISLKAKSFLKWAGGKKWFLREIDTFIDINHFNSYHEPFVGGGSVFFHLSPKKSFISDTNAELINTYKAIQKNPELVIRHLKKMKKTESEYYSIRKINYRSEFQRAAKFIYLNHMSFNGIYRVNLSGEYNVPFGRRENYQFDFENILLASKALKGAKITHQDFAQSLSKVKKGDLVFLDPPYTVTHNSNGFIKYNQKLFSLEDQCRLSDSIELIKHIGAFYILTNAAHETIKKIFANGDKMFETKRACLIGGKNAIRGKFTEIILTNV